MKEKILALSILSILTLSSFANAGELLLEPSNGKYSPGCMIGIDIVMDPEGKEISATDIVIESSMKFIKFEATEVFPYFFPPKTIGNMVHIVGFTSGPSQWIKEKGVIGKIYFKPLNKSDLDGSIKFFIKKKGDTTDSNMSIGGGIDVLEDTRNGFYTFDGDDCTYPEEEIIEIQETTTKENFEKSLDKTIQKVEKEHRSETLKQSRENNKSYIIGLFIIVILLAIYFKVFKGNKKH
ncbi:hypothetical protein K9M48_01320 [Candidatus Gracilibacteria bacterium]|nr:hypothetical protein [Candidatus Gracilibacteria bacterium]